ncbi:MAG TPA: aminotransferase class V-fold PLP-dependent enzyme [Phycisphaerae bacterium]|nr:aminotransferase class V-fold PLP-dependent enzyme [Phycisphaerae bacterium]HNU46082.1 aminotransferase class V-fold PLP-dependent enzyme [Phycisphaerae bacterium]
MDWQALRDEFPITRNYNFLNHAAAAPISRRAADAARRYLTQVAEGAYLHAGFFKHVEHVRSQAAQLVGANPDEIAFIKNTSEGISFVANGLNWQSGDNVVTSNAEFPSNIYPWQALRARGVQVRMVLEEDGRIPLERLLAAIDSRTRVVSLSHVQFATGYRTDLASLGAYCQSKGVLLCVDAIQSLGAFPVDVKAMNVDFLSADGHKWLCAPEGAGIFYVRKELQGHLRPTTIGWLSMKEPFDFDRYQFEFAESARRYESGSYNLAGIYALGGALELIHEIGLEHISHRLLYLTDRLAAGVREKGYRVVSPRTPTESSGILAFRSDLHDHDRIQRHLETEHRIVIACRRGRLRASPHVYNSEREIDQLVAALPKH